MHVVKPKSPDGGIQMEYDMNVETFRFRPAFARRIPDPNFKKSSGAERHIFVMPVNRIPPAISLDPNARTTNIRKRVYRQVEQSLLESDGSQPGTFHLKNKGITIVADSVSQAGDHEYIVSIRNGVHGIVDGGHTYELITRNLHNGLPDDQYVTVEVRVGIPDNWIPDIAGGLNTTVQVQPMSLDDLKGEFTWIKDELKSEPYYSEIAWSENDKGEFDARDIIAIFLLFNIELFPNDREEQPVMGYANKGQALKKFEEAGESFKRMRPILKEVLKLHDIIRRDARYLWNQKGGKGGALFFVEHRKTGVYDFPFTGKIDEFRLMTGVLYPMLAAFRWYVDRDPMTLKMTWRGGFSAVLDAWENVGAELVQATIQTSSDLGRNPQSIGKSRNHWTNLHARVMKYALLKTPAMSA